MEFQEHIREKQPTTKVSYVPWNKASIPVFEKKSSFVKLIAKLDRVVRANNPLNRSCGPIWKEIWRSATR
jgi:hypothetical protein